MWVIKNTASGSQVGVKFTLGGEFTVELVVKVCEEFQTEVGEKLEVVIKVAHSQFLTHIDCDFLFLTYFNLTAAKGTEL